MYEISATELGDRIISEGEMDSLQVETPISDNTVLKVITLMRSSKIMDQMPEGIKFESENDGKTTSIQIGNETKIALPPKGEPHYVRVENQGRAYTIGLTGKILEEQTLYATQRVDTEKRGTPENIVESQPQQKAVMTTFTDAPTETASKIREILLHFIRSFETQELN